LKKKLKAGGVALYRMGLWNFFPWL